MIQGIVLDAHGVIFQPTETNADALYRFVQGAGGEEDRNKIRTHYIAASLGRLAADDFWRQVGLTPTAEADYLAGIGPMPDLNTFLELAHAQALPLWCLSNDVGRWSETLRASHDINRHLQGWLISDAVGLRKPDPAIYRRFLDQFQLQPEGLVFVDDRLDNVETAGAMGFQAIQFRRQDGFRGIAERIWGAAVFTKRTECII